MIIQGFFIFLTVNNNYPASHYMKTINKELLREAASEQSDLKPFISKEEIRSLLGFLAKTHIEKNETNYKPSIYLDLEQLQVADYPSFFSTSAEEHTALNLIQESGNFSNEELCFLTLKSLVRFEWPKPNSNEDVAAAATLELSLHIYLAEMVNNLACKELEYGALIPYWARNTQINMLSDISERVDKEIGPKNIPCIVLRSHDINAYTYKLNANTKAIVLDYALEPFLKDVNAFLISFYSSKEYAGPRRIPRAAAEIIPRIMFFKGKMSFTSLPPFSILIGEGAVESLKVTTDDQIKFIFAHEIGHIYLDHPTQKEVPTNNRELLEMIEYEADSFALEWARSRTLNDFRYFLNPRVEDKEDDPTGSMISSLSTYANFYTNVEILFLILDFMEELFGILCEKDRSLKGSDGDYKHPAAKNRIDRLKKKTVYDAPINTDFSMFSKNLFDQINKHVKTLKSDNINDLMYEAINSEFKN